ncbi:tryptophan--tRNA ligase [Candidatus Leptofilum sp.]|uniref:tryptophan--tRNA ligase n=1 Tax=Candidatus Leptofilum sp. TaxID=3241576 RepID=UPI003B5C9C6B
MNKKRILTGDRPTGKLHLGHYVGSIVNRVRLQDEYESFFIIADLHVLTTKNSKDDIFEMRQNMTEMVIDYLACGIDPAKSVIYLQSAIHAVYEMNLIFEMLTTVPRLSRLPSLKDMARAAHLNEMPFGLLGYPVLQAADILMPRAHLVPVGKDNESHVEITRELARRFNYLYGETLPVPEVLVGDVPTLVGTDGKAKMSKSLGNAILLSDDSKTVAKKIRNMYTDPKRVHADIPGTVEGNPVFVYHDAFNPDKAEIDDLKTRYRSGKVGDVEVKEKLTVAINNFLDPIREKRAEIEADSGLVEQVIYEGTVRINKEAEATLLAMKKAMGLTGNWNKISRKGRKRLEKKGSVMGETAVSQTN